MIDVLNFLFPSNIYCMACGNLIDNSRPYSLCDSCLKEINWITGNTCKICGKSLGDRSSKSGICFECLGVTHNFVKGYSCVTYEGPVKEILSGFKYKGRTYYARNIVQIMGDRAEEFIGALEIDLIIPVPMHIKKERKRGYNQSKLLAAKLGKTLGIKVDSTILVKSMNTQAMSGLDRTERRINLHNAFDIGYNKKEELMNKRVMLIDDVYTTGSTMDACAEVLNANGALAVYAYTFTSGVNMNRTDS
jgi:ComF family protein